MANEIRITGSLRWRDASITPADVNEPDIPTLDIDATGKHHSSGVAEIAFGASNQEAIPVADIATPGLAYFRNLDDTNYVEIGIDASGTFHPTIKLKAGEWTIARLATTAPYALANTAAVNLRYLILED